MQQIKTSFSVLVLVSVLFLISCNEAATPSDKKDKDTALVVSPPVDNTLPEYDAALDPYLVSGKNAKLLQDTLGIKIFEWWAKPGELIPIHQHPDHAMYVLQGGKAMVYSKDMPGAENGFVMEIPTGVGWVGGPVKDSARNIGTTTIKMVEIDVYRPRSK